MSKHIHTYLALGDSYSIGESVPLHENFPVQLVQMLRKKGHLFHAPEIIAKTGWTSFELAEHLLHWQLADQYDFVSLLIGVNNQYRGLAPDEFATDFAYLLRKAIHLTGGKAGNVFVLSIPDWGITPFAAKKDASQIKKEIDAYNTLCETEALQNGAHYLNITAESRKAGKDSSLLAEDGLHYSGKAYAIWAAKVFDAITHQLK